MELEEKRREIEWNREGEGGRKKGACKDTGEHGKRKRGEIGEDGEKTDLRVHHKRIKSVSGKEWQNERMESTIATGEFTDRNVNKEIFTTEWWREEGMCRTAFVLATC